jgi:hypothetical protein
MQHIRELKEYFNLEYATLMKDVPTRWLSLYKTVEHLLAFWPTVKSYFVNLGEENCIKKVWKFVSEQRNEITDDFVKSSLPETYLQFMHHYINIMSQPLLSLQSNSISSTKVHGIMVQLKKSINNGNIAKTEIQKGRIECFIAYNQIPGGLV